MYLVEQVGPPILDFPKVLCDIRLKKDLPFLLERAEHDATSVRRMDDPIRILFLSSDENVPAYEAFCPPLENGQQERSSRGVLYRLGSSVLLVRLPSLAEDDPLGLCHILPHYHSQIVRIPQRLWRPNYDDGKVEYSITPKEIELYVVPPHPYNLPAALERRILSQLAMTS